MKLTVFTPTYNRAYILPELYRSLCRQSSRNFEWLIVDDGSTDDTENVVAPWLKDNKIDIRYIKQTNGGKHTAINRGAQEAAGELFMIVDSDDSLTPDAVEWVLKNAANIMADPSFAGLSGIRISPDGKKIGGGPDFGTIDSNAIDIRLKERVVGDLAEVFKTDVLRRFPFPKFEGERFCPEALVWNRIAFKYKIRFIHHGIYICEYLPDGLTAKITRLRHNSPKASMLYYSEFFHAPIPFMSKLKAAINFHRFAPAGTNKKEYRMNGILSSLMILPGKIMKHRDKKS